MLVVCGGSALSQFRIDKKLSALKSICPSINSISTNNLYLVDITASLDKDDIHKLEILVDGKVEDKFKLSSNTSYIVIPRPGTISPWSSKATDILHHCGLPRVNRIERGVLWQFEINNNATLDHNIFPELHDRMTQAVVTDMSQCDALFISGKPKELTCINIQEQGKQALVTANNTMGLALSDEEMDYLFDAFNQLNRNPTDVEIMMFAQANSEHCRHKIFNADWTIDGQAVPERLFGMIRSTFEANPGKVLSAYKDNAAVMRGYQANRFFPDTQTHQYRYIEEDVNILMKVETHNHPTGISPFPGAATGSGGEIRDEAATGTGAKPKAGMNGFTVSNLKIPDQHLPWETDFGKPERMASALDIMIEGPIGAASYNNEFGRPALNGFFRTYEQLDPESKTILGFHKPIMLAGGFGSIRKQHIHKGEIPEKAKLIVLGGPAMLIGLGGGAASSVASGKSDAELDFASVQRENPEIQRRCQEVIDRCWALGDNNPIISIHDVGAGGLSNALPEIVYESKRGATFSLRDIPNDDRSMSPMEIWCNESQERYVMAIHPDSLAMFKDLCQRERAPYAVIGEANNSGQLILEDSEFKNKPIDMPLEILLGKPPKIHRKVEHAAFKGSRIPVDDINFNDAVKRVLQLPTVADKRFLITIGDRSISGLVVRDQMVGPWQCPVADAAVTVGSYSAYTGEAMAVGERPPVAVINAPASGRLALAEAITNICAARITSIQDIALSANWMAACGHAGEDAKLFDTVKAVSDLAKSLQICIPVGKDSLSMNTIWNEEDTTRQVHSPLSVNITAFAPVSDIRKSLTPQLQENENSSLLLIDLGNRKNRLGGSCLAQVFNSFGTETSDLDDPALLSGFFQAIQLLNEMGLIMAYHDRSDGGLFVTLCEMAFAGHVGVDININNEASQLIPYMFSEEPGAVIQVNNDHLDSIKKTFIDSGLPESLIQVIGKPTTDKTFKITFNSNPAFQESLTVLHGFWSSTTYHMQSLRDNPQCASEEYDAVINMDDPGLDVSISFDMNSTAPGVLKGIQPKMAILREQGVNGQMEMAAAFHRAGFDTIDVHMSDLLNQSVSLEDFTGIVACGGFSYGDVLGAGDGWAKSILFNSRLRDEFQAFFERPATFGLGVCNGCQMFSHLRELIPGASHWPDFLKNRSEQFEARLLMVEILDSPSILTKGMAGSKVPVVVAHGEGQAVFKSGQDITKSNPALRYINNNHHVAENYPANPNGSIDGLTGFANDDGRFTIMMPHPERVFLSKQWSWKPDDWNHEETPWMMLFKNARASI